MSETGQAEAAELDRAAEWRLRVVDRNPDDAASAVAARQLQKLASAVRALEDSPLLDEFRCICNWLAESDGIEDLLVLMREYHIRIGFGAWPETGEDYLRALLGLAKQTFGAP